MAGIKGVSVIRVKGSNKRRQRGGREEIARELRKVGEEAHKRDYVKSLSGGGFEYD